MRFTPMLLSEKYRTSMSKPRLFFPKLALIVLATLSASLRAQVAGTAIVSNAPSIGGTVLGSIQVLSAQSFAINSGAAISGDILLPGTPTVTLNGSPIYSGTTVGTGAIGAETAHTFVENWIEEGLELNGEK